MIVWGACADGRGLESSPGAAPEYTRVLESNAEFFFD
jgi:hypothetical protein